MSEENWKSIEKYCIEQYGVIPNEFKLMRRYFPDVIEGFVSLRKATTKEPPVGALPKRFKELIIVAIETALKKPALLHAKNAIKAGATVKEVAEVVSICIWLAGMASYVVAGYPALKAAEEQAQENERVTYKRGM